MVACQQNLSLLLESSQFEPTTNRHLQDLITDEFDRYRKFTNLLQMRPIPELQVLKNKNNVIFIKQLLITIIIIRNI